MSSGVSAAESWWASRDSVSRRIRSRRSASRSCTARNRAPASWPISIATMTMVATKAWVRMIWVPGPTGAIRNRPQPCVVMVLARTAVTAPAIAAPSMSSRNAAHASTGRMSIDGGASAQNEAMVSAPVSTSTPAVSHGRRRTMADWVVHSRIGDAMTSTPSASPDHQVTTALRHGRSLKNQLPVPPIRPPNTGAIRQAAAMKTKKSRRLRRSGRPPHQASTSEAPIIGSTTLAVANTTDSPGMFP